MNRKFVVVEKAIRGAGAHEVSITNNYTKKSSQWTVVFMSEDISECRIIAKAYMKVGYQPFGEEEDKS